MSEVFYLYEHVRQDSGAVFYVGKGCGYRASTKQGRNQYWRNVVAKAGGYEVRYAARGLSEELAHLAEVERIDQLRRLGAAITNLTDGGEGASGMKIPRESVERRAALMRGVARPDVSARFKGVAKTEEHRRNQSAACKGRRLSDETKKKIGAASKGRPSSMLGKSHSAESKKKISDALKGEKNPFFGRSHPPEVVRKIVAANVGRKDSEETRLRKSIARRGDKNPLFGKRISEAQKQKQIASLKARPRVTCPHCAKVMDESNAKRWHLDNCKDKP